MSKQKYKNKKSLLIFLDIISVLAVLTFANLFLGIFGLSNISLVEYMKFPLLIGTIYFIMVSKFYRTIKKGWWTFLNPFAIIGPLITYISLLVFLSISGRTHDILFKGASLHPLTSLWIQFTTIIILIGLGSLIVFYFKYYRKYLSGKKSIQELGLKEN